MTLKRRFLSLVSLVLIFCCILSLPALAVSEQQAEISEPQTADSYSVQPCYVDIAIFNVSCGISSGGKAHPYAYVMTADSSYKIYLTVSLQRYKNGAWTTVKSWTSSGTHFLSISKYYYVTSGYTYRTCAYANVYTSDGTFVESQGLHSTGNYY